MLPVAAMDDADGYALADGYGKGGPGTPGTALERP